MTSMIALIHREFLEHRGAFLYAPAALLVLFALVVASALATNNIQLPLDVDMAAALRFYEIAFLGLGALWLAYMTVALFFYFADAFSADRRNSAMLFWKSMPQSDFKILSAKMLAGMTLLPALIFAMLVLTGIVLYALTALSVLTLPRLVVPGIGEFLASSSQVGLFALVYIGLSLLWYAPFFAWVGSLSTIVGRWSIPLAFLIPGLAVLVENIFVRGTSGIIGDLLVPGDRPRGGYIAGYLGDRADFGFDSDTWQVIFLTERPVEAMTLIQTLVAGIDWTQMAIGIAVAAVLVFLASEYRRRFILT